jgi:anti-sigma factor RsiW
MKCEEVSQQLIEYLDRRANSAERQEMEEHLAACAACRGRAEEFRALSGVLDELPAVEPSFGFDARVRQRIAAEPQRKWFGRLMPQPRLAFSMALLLALCILVVKLPQRNPGIAPTTAASENEQFQEIRDLGVLEDYDVLTNFDALSELTPVSTKQPQDQAPPAKQSSNDNGGA